MVLDVGTGMSSCHSRDWATPILSHSHVHLGECPSMLDFLDGVLSQFVELVHFHLLSSSYFLPCLARGWSTFSKTTQQKTSWRQPTGTFSRKENKLSRINKWFLFKGNIFATLIAYLMAVGWCAGETVSTPCSKVIKGMNWMLPSLNRHHNVPMCTPLSPVKQDHYVWFVKSLMKENDICEELTSSLTCSKRRSVSASTSSGDRGNQATKCLLRTL